MHDPSGSSALLSPKRAAATAAVEDVLSLRVSGHFSFFSFGSYSSAATSFPGSLSPFRCSRLVVVFFAPCVAHHLQLLTTVTTVLQSGGFSGLQPHTAAKDGFRFSLQNKVNNDIYNISVLLLHEKININIKITIIIIDNYYY